MLFAPLLSLPHDASQEAEDYEKWLRAKLSHYGVDIAPYPEVTHERLVQRAVDRTKPFRENKGMVTGYRDSLIWFTLLKQADSNRVAFVSHNHTDFQEERGGRLYADLRDDLQAQSMNDDQIKVFNSIDEARKSYGTPDSGLLQEIQELLRTDARVQEAFEKSAGKALTEWLRISQSGAKPLIPIIGLKDIQVALEVKAKAISKAYESEGNIVITDLLVSGTGEVSYEYPRISTLSFPTGSVSTRAWVIPKEGQVAQSNAEDGEDLIASSTGFEKLQFQAALTMSFDRNTNEIIRADVMHIEAE